MSRNATKNAKADAASNESMDKSLARDLDDFGAKPAETSDADWALFQARRRAERMQVDVDEGRATQTERTQFTADVLEKDKHPVFVSA